MLSISVWAFLSICPIVLKIAYSTLKDPDLKSHLQDAECFLGGAEYPQLSMKLRWEWVGQLVCMISPDPFGPL